MTTLSVKDVFGGFCHCALVNKPDNDRVWYAFQYSRGIKNNYSRRIKMARNLFTRAITPPPSPPPPPSFRGNYGFRTVNPTTRYRFLIPAAK